MKKQWEEEEEEEDVQRISIPLLRAATMNTQIKPLKGQEVSCVIDVQRVMSPLYKYQVRFFYIICVMLTHYLQQINK